MEHSFTFILCILQDCAPGFRRVDNVLYGGTCERCECNGHSDSCNPYTGECLVSRLYIDGLVQERRNSSSLAMELHLSCINPSICIMYHMFVKNSHIEAWRKWLPFCRRHLQMHFLEWELFLFWLLSHITVLVVNYGISNTVVLEIP